MAISIDDLMSLLEKNTATQADLSTKQDDILDQVSQIVLQEQAIAAEGQVALDSYSAATRGLGAATTEAVSAETAANTAQLPAILAAEQGIRDASDASLEYSAKINQAYQTQVDELLGTLAVVEEGAAVGPMDLLNPKTFLPSLKAKISAGVAGREAEAQLQQLQVLDAAQRFNTANWQQTVSTQKELREARQLEHSQLYFKQFESAAVVRQLQAAKDMATADLEIIRQRFGFNETSMSALRTQLETYRAQGDLSQRQLSSAISAIQVQQSQEQLKVWKESVARDEAMRARLDNKFQEASQIFGLDISSMAEYEILRKDLTPEAQYSISQYVTTGVVNAANIWGGTSPSTAIRSMGAVEAQQVLTPEAIALASRVRESVMSAPGRSVDMADPEAMQRAVDEALNKTYRDAFLNVDTLYNAGRGLFQVPNPAKMDYSGADGLSIPMAAVPILQKLNVNATDMNSFAAGVIRAAIADENSMANLEALSQGLAEISSTMMRGINQATGFGLTNMYSLGLGADGMPGDATNAGDWYKAIQLAAARERVRMQRGSNLGRSFMDM